MVRRNNAATVRSLTELVSVREYLLEQMPYFENGYQSAQRIFRMEQTEQLHNHYMYFRYARGAVRKLLADLERKIQAAERRENVTNRPTSGTVSESQILEGNQVDNEFSEYLD